MTAPAPPGCASPTPAPRPCCTSCSSSGCNPAASTNADLRALLAGYFGRPPGTITPGQATYDLRRLKDHGFIQRIAHTHRYRITGTGLAQAMFLARAHDRLLVTGLAELTAPAGTSPIRNAARAYQAALDDLSTRAGLHIAA